MVSPEFFPLLQKNLPQKAKPVLEKLFTEVSDSFQTGCILSRTSPMVDLTSSFGAQLFPVVSMISFRVHNELLMN